MKQRGFSLIELIIVIAIMAILAGALVPVLQNQVARARLARANADLDAIVQAAAAMNADTGQWPPASAAGNDLIANTNNLAGWAGPYLQAWQNDPWGNAYRITVAGTKIQAESFGPNGAAAGGDDIVRIIRQ